MSTEHMHAAMEKNAEVFPLDLLELCRPAASPFATMRGWIADASRVQVVFWHSEKGLDCAAHDHPYAEWGIVVSGWCDLTIQGGTHRYRAGDCFYIPPGAPHSAVMSAGYRAIDLFGRADHIKAQ